MTYQHLNCVIKGPLAWLTLQRPTKCNALNYLLIQELLQAIEMLSQNEQIKILILNGKGEHFCAGADIAWLQNLLITENASELNTLGSLLYRLAHFPKPTLALAQGAIRGGGIGLLAACDWVIASHDASFAFSEVKIGLTPSIISPYIIQAIGERAARYYFLTGNRFDAEKAQQLGLIHQIIAADLTSSIEESLHRHAQEQIKSLLKNSPYAMREVKNLMSKIAGLPITPALVQTTVEHLCQIQSTPEAKEGLTAFIEKRSPNWISNQV